jgi:macrodomain Ter protein organizer (MatP/YcbG family)
MAEIKEARKISDLFNDFSKVLSESLEAPRQYEKKTDNIYKPEQARYKLVIWFKDGNRRYFFSYDNKHYKDKVITDEYEGLLKLIRLTHKYKDTFKNAILYATVDPKKEVSSNYCVEILKVDIYGNKKTNKAATFKTENNNVHLDLVKLNTYGTQKIKS